MGFALSTSAEFLRGIHEIMRWFDRRNGSMLGVRPICVVGLRGLPNIIGGIETFCQNLYPELICLNPFQPITVLARQGYLSEPIFMYRGVEVECLWSPRFLGIDAFFHTAWAIIYARFVRSVRIVHVHGIGPSLFVPIAKLFGMKVVVIHHAPDFERPRWSWFGRAVLLTGERIAASCADAVVCVSHSVRKGFVKRHAGAVTRTHVIRSASGFNNQAIDEHQFDFGKFGLERDKYVLAVSRLEETKGLDILISAFLKATRDDLKLVIVGTGDGGAFEAKLRSLASDRIVFVGFQTGRALRSFFEGAALFVHASRMEGYGLVVAEALSLGRPVLLSDIPPHREFELKDPCYFAVDDVASLESKISSASFQEFIDTRAIHQHRTDSWRRVALEYNAILERVYRD